MGERMELQNKKKIKILQFPIANSKGGITHYALENWKWMNKEDFQCDFATMSKRLDFEEEILATGSKVFYISCYAEENAERFAEEFGAILERGYDIVHLHTKQWKSFVAEEVCRIYHIPKVIVHAHGVAIDTLDLGKRNAEEQLHEIMKSKLVDNIATDFWACSQDAASFLFGNQIWRDKVKVIPNAIDIEKFSFRREVRDKYRTRYGLGNCSVIGHVGRFEYSKNHEFLIDVFHEAQKRKASLRLVLIGEGQLFGDIQKKVERLRLSDKVLFLGKRDDVNNWYQAIDIFCLPSRFEALSISMIEAQAAGLCCLGSDRVPEEAKICENTYLLPLELGIWVSKILDAMNNINSKKRTKDNQLCLRQKGYDIRTQIKCIEEEYMSVDKGKD